MSKIPLPPWWLVEYARQLVREGCPIDFAPAALVAEARRRTFEGDLEAAMWELHPASEIGMRHILSCWVEADASGDH